MKRHSRYLPLLLTVFLTVMLCALPVSANSAEPPGLTVLVVSPPDELRVSLAFEGGERAQLPEQKKVWESYYTFYYHNEELFGADLSEAELVFSDGGEERICPLPVASFSHYNNLVTLDWASGTVTLGQPAWRTPVLVALRVMLTLLIEGCVFWLMGYRKKSSWLVFLGVNLATQTALNLFITGPNLAGYWFIGFVLGEILIFAAETAVYLVCLKEREKARAAICALLGNALSLWIGGCLIQFLPV